jgi:hypothetical protein
MALATHSQFLITAYVIDTQHEKKSDMRTHAGSAYWEKKTKLKFILEAILYGK